MADILELTAFDLPPTFSLNEMPEIGTRFLSDCKPGITKEQLVSRARRRGWRPDWTLLAHLTEGDVQVYGFTLIVEGRVVPLLARMRCRASALTDSRQESDPRQASLF
ncbi:hypothetical protein K788_00000390 [Paraburkholderia caribensis MBA4]|uniref:Uncharacterized protein n=1 Tax=Paraburkholderia caribensis MBA4 TaxID=1323664 RepID=A0A0P0RJS1_9BURK|nr:hypothetical protein [Paraburkholderia caribensis]ALL68922.1 hypothetical protein K788_00000390 [Paraburkholderia caribensis MBA4]